MRRAFTLIELLVVIAVAAVLVSLLLPAMRGARESGWSAVCLSNLRQSGMACRMYADANKGRGPAIGQPYTALPNWALVVQSYAHRAGEGAELYSAKSALVCPSIAAFYRQEQMVRTYAMNATGHAGLPGDPDNFDAAVPPAHLNLDAVADAGGVPLLMDSRVPPPTTSNPPPPTRTASTLDFRQASHVAERLGWFHASTRAFHAAMMDGSARAWGEVRDGWRRPLP